MTTITITRPATVLAPRGALWAARAAATLLEVLGRAIEHRAQVQAALTRAEEAAAVRRLADSWTDTDPRMAADLYAAADRHERV